MNDVRSERDRLLAAVEAEAEAGRPFALATIVDTRGSTYRHAGARLLVRGDGTWLGNISGGCLEGEVLDVGQRVIDTDTAELAQYDLTADEEAIWGWGLGCNGAIDVLVEPAGTAAAATRLLRRGADTGASHVVVTVVHGGDEVPAGGHLLVTADEAEGPLGARPEVVAAARAALADRRSQLREVRVGDTDVTLFLEVVRPPLRLLVCGAGHDAVPLVRSARQLGWEPVVVDDRSSFLTEDRFPEAAAFVRTEPGKAAAAAGVRERTAAVIMSHNFLRDVDYLGSFLEGSFAADELVYLGVLGPGRRLERLLDQLADRGVEPSDGDRARLHGPAGLDVGAEGPDEIAWAICAQILAVDRGHAGGHLRDRAGSIHDPSA